MTALSDTGGVSRRTVIEARRITKVYGQPPVEVAALRGVDLELRTGEMTALIGPSGSGKSTLLHVLGGIERPTTGEVLLDGADMSLLSDDERTILRRRRLGFVFQRINLLPALSAVENVALPLLLDKISSREAEERSRQMLRLVGLEQRAGHLPAIMSGGEQQRVAIARALVTHPAMILADEPTGSLDSVNAENIIALLTELVERHGHSVLLVTHDSRVAAKAHRVIEVNDGLCQAHSPAEHS